jgi:hypothetical protein
MERSFNRQGNLLGVVSLRKPVSLASAERLFVAGIRYGMTPEAQFHFQCIVRVTVRDWLQPMPLILMQVT